jgi:hypothetical protein
MEQHAQEIPRGHALCTRALTYRYRFCPRCRREWPADHKSCPECVHWLGEQPLERTEWQLAPARTDSSASQSYELIGASAFVLRIVAGQPPADKQLAKITEVISEILAVASNAPCEVGEHGWLVWTMEGLRRSFRMGLEIEQRLTASLPRLERILLHSVSIRWGVWIDQYIVPFDGQNQPAIKDVTARSIFNFEPDNFVFSSESIYQTNRRWEHFVCRPHRLLDGREAFGYQMTGHKRPSALDHFEAGTASPFVARERQLSVIEDCWNRTTQTTKLAITAAAGSGKTRKAPRDSRARCQLQLVWWSCRKFCQPTGGASRGSVGL